MKALFLLEKLRGGFIDELTMLDTHDAEFKRPANVCRVIDVDSDVGLARFRFLYCGLDLGIGILGCKKRTFLRGDSASDHNLKLRGSLSYVLARSCPYRIGAIGED